MKKAMQAARTPGRRTECSGWAIGRRALAVLATWLLLTGPARADFPALLGTLEVPVVVDRVKVSADARLLAALSSPFAAGEQGVYLFDLTDPRQPVPRGFVPGQVQELALSPDGRRLLMLEKAESPGAGEPDRWRRLSYLDLSDADRPRLLWQRNVQAGDVQLAPDASAYAVFALQREDPPQWLTTVTWTEAQRPDVRRVDDAERPMTLESLSAGGRLLSYRFGGRLLYLRLVPVSAASPVMGSVMGSAMAPDGSDELTLNCLIARLPSGLLVSGNNEDDGWQLAVDSVRQVPAVRLGTLALGQRWPCRMSAAGVGEQGVYLRSGPALLWLDLHDPHRPVLQPLRHLPHGFWLDAVVGRLLVARLPRVVDPEPPAPVPADSPPSQPVRVPPPVLLPLMRGTTTLELYSLDETRPLAIDWPALVQVYRQVLKDRHGGMDLASMPTHERPGRDFGLMALEAAGIDLAIDAPLDGYPAREAAQMLCDYAELLRRWGDLYGVRERAQQRCQRLVPGLQPSERIVRTDGSG